MICWGLVWVAATPWALADEPPATDSSAPAAAADPAAPAVPPATPEEFFRDRFHPFLTQYCLECHSGKSPKGALGLDQWPDLAAARGQRALWLSVAEMLEAEGMPPEKQAQPPEGLRPEMAAWIRQHLATLDCQGPRDPGRVTLRRLNRTEYRNTIRDLVGLDYQPAADFPADDVAAGFDNIADALSLPPVLMEKYLAAAATIAAQAIVAPEAYAAIERQFAPVDWHVSDGAGSSRDGWLTLYSPGEATQMIDLGPGQYRLRLRAYGDQAGDEPPRLIISVGGRQLASLAVEATADSPADYEAALDWPGGSAELSLAFTNDFYDPNLPEGTPRDRNLLIESLVLTGPLNAQPPPRPASQEQILFRGGDDSPEAVEAMLQRLVSRAFRRPARAEEVARLAGLVRLAREQGDSQERAFQLVLEAVLVSPRFLFRIEVDDAAAPADGPAENADRIEGQPPSQPSSIRRLNSYELATRMSYFLWSSMPDEALFAAASSGSLEQQLEQQVARMLADRKSLALAENFALQWLTLRNLEKINPDPERFPTWDEPLRSGMRQEAVALFDYIVRENRSLLELLHSDYTFFNERLARHYGLAGVTGEEFRKVSWSDERRGGVLSLAGVLTVTSNPTRTSPVKRGKWVLEQILGAPPPPPPPNVPELKEDARALAGLSLRQRMEEHRANPSCAACHAKMDPLGFGLENFNAIGGWRDHDGGAEIDASGELPDGSVFRGPQELRKILLGRAGEFRRTLVRQMLTYALGRSLDDSDECFVLDLAAQVEAEGDRLSSLIAAIVASEPFGYCRLPAAETEKAP